MEPGVGGVQKLSARQVARRTAGQDHLPFARGQIEHDSLRRLRGLLRDEREHDRATAWQELRKRVEVLLARALGPDHELSFAAIGGDLVKTLRGGIDNCPVGAPCAAGRSIRDPGDQRRGFRRGMGTLTNAVSVNSPIHSPSGEKNGWLAGPVSTAMPSF